MSKSNKTYWYKNKEKQINFKINTSELLATIYMTMKLNTSWEKNFVQNFKSTIDDTIMMAYNCLPKSAKKVKRSQLCK